MYTVVLSRKAEKALKKLPASMQPRIVELLENLQENPRPDGVKKLTDRDAWRMRIGDYRVVYTIHDKQLIVVVIKIAHRREAYRT